MNANFEQHDPHDPRDAQVESLLRDHLGATLDRHVGASARRFSQFLNEDAQQEKVPAVPVIRLATASDQPAQRSARLDGPRFSSFWPVGLIGAALAATITIVAMRHTVPAPAVVPPNHGISPDAVARRDSSKIPDHFDPSNNIVPAALTGEADLAVKTVDQGFVWMPDGTPARRLLQQRTKTIKLTDPRTNKTIEVIRPSGEETIYVGLKQY